MALLAASLQLPAQTASLRGQVTDESGAVVPRAKVMLHGPSGLAKTTTAAADGGYFFAGLALGDYTVQASAPQLTFPQPAAITLKPGVQTLNLQLKVAATTQELTVEDSAGPGVTADPVNNADAVVLRGDELQALGDNPDDLQADLEALAGPSAGPGGGSIFIDGFSGGQLPAKESIREIRINQNPFSPEYDKLGYGRIEIFTKPGTDKLRGGTSYNFSDAFWNSRNPYAMRKAPFRLHEFSSNLSGPMGKRASFFVDFQHHAIDNGAIINGITLDPATLAVIDPYTDVFRTPQRRTTVSPRVDYQLDAKNTLMFRYAFSRSDIRDGGIGSFNLISRGTHTTNTNQTVQATETAVVGAAAINETRFQFLHGDLETAANNLSPAIQVLGSFNGGGAPVGRSTDLQNHYELENYTSVTRGGHAIKFGVRLRGQTVDNSSPQNFGGTFTFGGGLVSSIERYRRTLLFQGMNLPAAEIRALGGGATQFTIAAGLPAISGRQVDAGVFAGDDWRVRPNLTLSLGLRYETQTNIHDWRDFAPRAGLAWAPGGKKKSVIRAGFGLFYDRFSLSNTLTALRYNGIVQQQYVVANPDFFPLIPALSTLAGAQSAKTVQQVSASLRSPYVMQSAAGFERQLPLGATISITYANSHGLHLLRSRDVNASSPVFQMESTGLYNQNQLITTFNSKVNKSVSLFGSYVLNRGMSNTDGLSTYPASPSSDAGEYGPAATDVHHRVSMGGSIALKWDVRLNPLVVAESGPPFDITVGHDLYGDTLFNGRPGIATDPNTPGVIRTSYGLLDPNPVPGEKILSRNFGRGPGSLMVNLRIGKTFTFGGRERGAAAPPVPGGPGGPDARRIAQGTFAIDGAAQGAPARPSSGRHYYLTVSMSIRNIFNHTNPGPIIGNITSPLFGQANQPAGSLGGTGFSEAANNRRLELQTRFTF